MKYKKKNKKWFVDFETRVFDDFYYVDANSGSAIKNTYFDLLVLRQGKKFNALPVPIFLRRHWPSKEEFPNDSVQATIWDYLDENEVKYSIISKDKYYQMMDEIRIQMDDEKVIHDLADNEKEILDIVEGNGYVLEETKNQYGESIPLVEITGNRNDGFEIYKVTCFSSSWLGLGTCQCNSHQYDYTEPISIRDVIEVVRDDLEGKVEARRKEREFISSLPDDDKKLLQEIQENGLILEEVQNQFGEKVTTKSIYADGENFELIYLNCLSSEHVGMGICQCNNHPTWRTKEITAKEALELVKQIEEEENEYS